MTVVYLLGLMFILASLNLSAPISLGIGNPIQASQEHLKRLINFKT